MIWWRKKRHLAVFWEIFAFIIQILIDSSSSMSRDSAQSEIIPLKKLALEKTNRLSFGWKIPFEDRLLQLEMII